MDLISQRDPLGLLEALKLPLVVLSSHLFVIIVPIRLCVIAFVDLSPLLTPPSRLISKPADSIKLKLISRCVAPSWGGEHEAK